MRTTKSVAVAVVLVTALVVWWAPRHQAANFRPDPSKPNDKIRLEKELRTTLVQAVGGLLVAFGAFVAYRNLRTLQEGQITGQFTKSIELLGNEKLSVRLGGIYSLEMASKGARREYAAAMEVLCAYVRENSRKPDLREEIEAVMRVVGRRMAEWDDAARPLNLAEVDLGEVDLSGGNYTRIDFHESRFGPKLRGSRFDHADLNSCTFDGSDLTQASLTQTKVRQSSFSKARLFVAHLRNADLSAATLEGVGLWSADLTDADLRGAKLVGSSFVGAVLNRAAIDGADLAGAVVAPGQLDLASGSPATNPSLAGFRIFSVLHGSAREKMGTDSPVQAGEFLEIYCDGLGALRWPKPNEYPRLPRTAADPKVTIDGQKLSVTYCGAAPANPAGYQINVHVPSNLVPGQHSLEITAAGASPAVIEIASVAAS